MPKGPLIEDPIKRRVVVAIVMGLLLAAGLAAAARITGAALWF